MPAIAFLLCFLLFPAFVQAQPVSFLGTLDRYQLTLRHVRSACPSPANTTNFETRPPSANTVSFPTSLGCQAFQVNNVTARWQVPAAQVPASLASDTATTVTLAETALAPLSIAITGSAGWEGSSSEGAHSFYSRAQLNDFIGGRCASAADRVRDVSLPSPGTTPLDVEASCTLSQAKPLTIIPSSIQRRDNRVVAFEAPVTLTAWVDLAHGSQFGLGDWRGGIYTVTVQAIYKFVVALDLTMDHVEVTQVTQTVDNRIPWVAGKTTWVRAFAKILSGSDDIVEGVRMQLRGFRGSGELPGSPLAEADAGARIRRNPARDDFTFNFVLPPAWTAAGQIRLEAELNHDRGKEESNYGNNSIPVSVTFTEKPSLAIRHVRVCFVIPGVIPDCGSPNVGGNDFLARRLFPIADAKFSYEALGLPDQIRTEALTSDAADARFFTWLNQLDATAQANGQTYDQLVAWLPRGFTGDTLGSSNPPWDGGIGRVTFGLSDRASASGTYRTFAHELGHNYGLRHTNLADSCGSRDNGTDWPHPDSGIQEYGYNARERRFFPPPDYMDLMSYCNNRWISPHQYLKLFNGFTVAAPRSGPVRADAADLWIITGTVDRAGARGTIDPVLRLTSTQSTTPPSSSGTFCLRVEGASVTSFCFSPSFLDPESRDEIDTAPWVLRIPAVPGVRRFSLTRGGQEIASRAVSANPPSVQFLAPAANETWTDASSRTLRWQGTDLDGDTLFYSLAFSLDTGATWTPLAIDLNRPEFVLDPSRIAAGPQTLFRVMATDGFHTASASVGPINIQQRPAIAVDSQPVDLGITAAGRPVLRTATIKSTGTGPLVIQAITSSDPRFTIDAPVLPLTVPSGSTLPVEIHYAPASSGAHSATITVRSNAAGQETFPFQVKATASNGQTPIADVIADATVIQDAPPSAPQRLQVTLFNRSFVPLAASWRTEGAGYRVRAETPSATVASGGQEEIAVLFESATPGNFEGRLILTTNDPALATIIVPLSVTVVAVEPQAAGPRINRGGVVDAAQFQPAVSPGGIATIFGADLAPSVQSAGTVPLPRQIAGVRVLIQGIAAPLFFIAPSQINVQVPFEVPPGAAVAVVVERDGVQSAPETVRVAEYAPAVFKNAATGDPIVTRFPDNAIITAANPARPGDVLIVYLTGVGGLTSTPATGEPTGVSPLPTSREPALVTLAGQPVSVLFTGLAPYFIGLAQINLQLPAALPPGAKLPLEIRIGGFGGIPVPLPVLYDAPASAAIAVQPGSLAFGDVATGQTRELVLTVRSTGTAPLNIREIASSNPRFTFTGAAPPFNLSPGASLQLAVRFSPAAAGPQTGTLTLASNDPANPTLPVALSGTGIAVTVPQPAIDVTPAELAFGPVNNGQTKDLALTIRNTGAAPLIVSSTASSSPLFATPGFAVLSVAPGAQQSVTVRYAPASAGDHTATLTVASNDPAHPSVAVRATGRGVTPGPQSIVLQVDDGTFERSIAIPDSSDGYFINRLTPPSYPATLKSVRIFFSNRSLPPGESFTLLTAAHPSGTDDIGSPSFRTLNGRVIAQDQFNDFEVPPVTISSGDFLVGFATPQGVLQPMAVDKTAPYRNRSYVSSNGSLYEPVGNRTVEGQGNFAIRAVVELSGN